MRILKPSNREVVAKLESRTRKRKDPGLGAADDSFPVLSMFFWLMHDITKQELMNTRFQHGKYVVLRRIPNPPVQYQQAQRKLYFKICP